MLLLGLQSLPLYGSSKRENLNYDFTQVKSWPSSDTKIKPIERGQALSVRYPNVKTCLSSQEPSSIKYLLPISHLNKPSEAKF
jgi:hypothetical protein